ncbi:WbuC family cupin fold metalloprotein [Leptospira interrogans]|uniref:Cupin fold metalloprotein, WbuC family n=1 Tax=Leptospira interrogans serovar Pomona TaxID=44276 RepID=A0AA40WEB1_LEPIR|nr:MULTISPECIES: WbuC family cupin fold metalloprotein [Leptospira]EJO77751.1 hypothetical protein LEP1GSC045_1471 [Leptospira interrogans serovar Pomona str. Kennewicki LC82-25]EKN96473.1 hypothetical protein LEP1GSC014_0777 [Leptospira interrogans serovar Pomona str. Pomona]EMF35125.1 cupin fold metalloprotein, WbuC family [Leptospira interrogans serovar Pomona str. Fox 32256]EMI71305.1 cupin fold metalloprotein, WbuC family [Leptospira interrogans serovar Pomona str. CSL10083]EMJ61255.1 cup
MIDFTLQEKYNEEVYHSSNSIIDLDREDVNQLILLASSTKRTRVRFCSHNNSSEALHEMFIVHSKDTYVRPHKHLNKPESMLVLEGKAQYITFYDDGQIENCIQMGTFQSGDIFYHSIKESKFHSLLIQSGWLVFLEITKGPFFKADTQYAPWSPEESDIFEVSKFMRKVQEKL